MAVVVDNKDHTVDELSALFDEIEVGKNLDVEKASDYGTASTGNLRPFADRCEDVKAMMGHESVKEDREIETDVVVSEPTPPVEAQPEPDLELESTPKENKDNPLGFHGEDLLAFQKIAEKYPTFVLSHQSQAFREFYRFKVRALKSLLTSYPLLDLKDMDKEILSIKSKFQGSCMEKSFRVDECKTLERS
jgi:hypothetical protein